MTEGKKRRGISPIDILAVLGVVAVVAVLVMLFSGGENTEFDRHVYYTVEVNRIDVYSGVAEAIEVGADVRCTIFGLDIGTVYHVLVVPYTQWVFNEDEQIMQEVPEPGFVRLYVTIRSPGLDNGRAIEVISRDYEIRVGRPVHFRGRGFQAYGFVIGIRQICMETGEELGGWIQTANYSES